MDIPIRLDGREVGRLDIRREGAYTCFSGRCEDPGRLVRLAVYGGEACGVLGVMTPENGALTLRRRLSRAALRGFPAVPEYAGPAPEGAAAAAGGAQPGRQTPANAAGSGPALRPVPGGTAEAARAPAPPEAPQTGTELLWYRAGDGSLYTSWQGREYRAIPMAALGLPRKNLVERRLIEGVEYAVYEAKNGTIF